MVFWENNSHCLSTLDLSQPWPSSRYAVSNSRRLDPRAMPSLWKTFIRSAIIRGYLSLRMTPGSLNGHVPEGVRTFTSMCGRQQPNIKPKQEEGDCFLGEAEVGAAGDWERVQFAIRRRQTERQVDCSMTALHSFGSSMLYAMRVLRSHGGAISKFKCTCTYIHASKL